MTNKEKYKQLCEQIELPLFMQYWWLEGVYAGTDWDIILIEQEGEIQAALPYQTDKWLWRRYVHPIEMVPYGGLWVKPELREDKEALKRCCNDIKTLLQEAKVGAYSQRFFPDEDLALAFVENDSKIGARRTYILKDIEDLDKVIEEFSRNKRKKLEKQTLTYKVEDIEPEEFYYFHVATCRQKNRRMRYTREMLLVIYEKAKERDCCRIVGVRDAHGELLAAALLVWDNKSTYVLANTFDHDHPSGGARELLTLEEIKHARNIHTQLDFTCSQDYLKNYGAKRHPLFIVRFGSLPLRAVGRLLTLFERHAI